MPTYSGSGTEPLGSDPQTFDATTSSSEKASPGGKGTDAKGDATNATTKSDRGKSTPSSGANTPKGVQTYDGDAT